MLVDLHVHTFAGGDSMAAPGDNIDRALAAGASTRAAPMRETPALGTPEARFSSHR